MSKAKGVFRVETIFFIFIVATLMLQLMYINYDFNLGEVLAMSVLPKPVISKPVRVKCDVVQACPTGHLTFKISSGVSTVVGPRICLEDKMLMSSVKNNVGKGLNIALANGKGELLKTAYFDMWTGQVAPLIKFLTEIEEGTLVMMTSFDDVVTKLNDEARKLISDLGSTNVTQLAFRDNWVFVGEKGIKTKSPFEQLLKNNVDSNRYDGWPEALELEGCIPMKVQQL